MTEKEIMDRVASLKFMAAILEEKIVDPKTREFFLRPVWNWLGDVENFLLPSAAKSAEHSLMWIETAQFILFEVDARLIHTREMVAKYGASLQLSS